MRDEESKRNLSRASVGCSYGAGVAIVVEWIIAIVIIAVSMSAGARGVTTTNTYEADGYYYGN